MQSSTKSEVCILMFGCGRQSLTLVRSASDKFRHPDSNVPSELLLDIVIQYSCLASMLLERAILDVGFRVRTALQRVLSGDHTESKTECRAGN